MHDHEPTSINEEIPQCVYANALTVARKDGVDRPPVAGGGGWAHPI